MIKIKKLSKKFGSVDVLKGVNMTLKPGLTAILGPNASGKTTLIKSILGLVIPDKGDILINDKSINKKWNQKKIIRYLPQIAKFPDNLTVNEIFAMIQDLRNEKGKPESLVTQFGLTDYLDKKLGNLSGGTRQKVNLVLTFMFDSEVLILDEPTSGLDPVSQLRLKEIIIDEKFKGRTIVMTTHIMSLVEELADEVAFLLEGKLYFQGSIDEIKKKAEKSDLEHAIAQLLSGHK